MEGSTEGGVPEVDPNTQGRNNPCARAQMKVLALLFERRKALIRMREAPLGMLVNYTIITPTGLPNKVFPRLRDSACWRSGEIMQPRTRLIREPCRDDCPIRKVMMPLHEEDTRLVRGERWG